MFLLWFTWFIITKNMSKISYLKLYSYNFLLMKVVEILYLRDILYLQFIDELYTQMVKVFRLYLRLYCSRWPSTPAWHPSTTVQYGSWKLGSIWQKKHRHTSFTHLDVLFIYVVDGPLWTVLQRMLPGVMVYMQLYAHRWSLRAPAYGMLRYAVVCSLLTVDH